MISLLSDDPLEQSLLRAIYEDWGDLTPVLIYADFLDEQATDETTSRARLLRETWAPDHPATDRETQASDPVDAQQAWITARKRSHERGLELDARGVLPTLVFRSVSRWLEAAGRWNLNDEPTALRFTSFHETDAIALILAKEGAAIRALDLSFTACGPIGAAHLAVGRRFAKLLRLDLKRTGLGDAGARALARGEGLQSLKSLVLADNDVGPSGAEAFCRSEHYPNLETLDLRGNPLRGAGRDACDTLRGLGVEVIDFA
ncbi:MAG TPA: TIGR02996 domain-containing protein [Pirellulales bacterium]